MTPPQTSGGLVLAVHPTSRGFGWVAFEGPFAPYDWGLVDARGDKNATCLRTLEVMIARLAPETLVVEDFDRRRSARADRISRLCRAMVSLAANRGLDVAIYSRGDVRACFASVGALTRQEIAEAVARHIDAFRHQLPKRRKAWDRESPWMSVFSATALVLTHYQLDARRLLDDLKEGG